MAKRLFDAHLRKHGPDSALFIGASIKEGPRRAAGSNLLQVAQQEFLYITESFDYLYFTNFDASGQSDLLRLIESFAPTTVHCHHFMGFGVDFLQALQAKLQVRTVFTLHEHMVVCQNDGHLLQRNNQRICRDIHAARCATCLPQYRYDYFQHRLDHMAGLVGAFDVVTAVSKFTADVVSSAIKTKAPIVVIPNGPVDAVPAATSIDLRAGLNIAYIGQIHRTKGVHVLLEAMLMVAKRRPRQVDRMRVSVWGGILLEDYRQEIESLVQQLQDCGVFARLAGMYDSSNLRQVLSDANVVVVPSLWPESYCITADEAVMHGKVLLCSDFPAARERFEEGGSVRFFAPGSAVQLATQFEDLLGMQDVKVLSPFTYKYQSFDEIYDAYEEHY